MPKDEDSSSAEACWTCGSSRVRLWGEQGKRIALRPDNLKITDSHYGTTLPLLRCSDCGLLFARREELGALVRLYEQLEDQEYVDTQSSRRLQMRWLVRKMRHFRPDARDLLDVGAGSGLLVAEARRQGLDALGVEPSRWLVEAAARVNSVQLLQGSFPHEAVAGRQFDLVALVDVVEHLADPLSTIRKCREALRPGGALLIVTPDVRSVLARILGRRWWHFRLAHVCYFGRLSLSLALEHGGLMPRRWFRTKWFFPLGYLARRLERYLPVRRCNDLLLRVPGFNRLVVPLNLRDSWGVLATPEAASQTVLSATFQPEKAPRI